MEKLPLNKVTTLVRNIVLAYSVLANKPLDTIAVIRYGKEHEGFNFVTYAAYDSDLNFSGFGPDMEYNGLFSVIYHISDMNKPDVYVGGAWSSGLLLDKVLELSKKESIDLLYNIEK